MSRKSLFPEECPLVLCGYCKEHGRLVVIELNGDVLVYKDGEPNPLDPEMTYEGENCIEFVGLEQNVEHWPETYEHDAQDPVPLTSFARELIAALKEEHGVL